MKIFSRSCHNWLGLHWIEKKKKISFIFLSRSFYSEWRQNLISVAVEGWQLWKEWGGKGLDVEPAQSSAPHLIPTCWSIGSKGISPISAGFSWARKQRSSNPQGILPFWAPCAERGSLPVAGRWNWMNFKEFSVFQKGWKMKKCRMNSLFSAGNNGTALKWHLGTERWHLVAVTQKTSGVFSVGPGGVK